MNLISKLFEKNKIVSTIPIKDKINDTINKVVEKIEVSNGKQTVDKYHKKKDKNYMYYKVSSYSVTTMANITTAIIKKKIPTVEIDNLGAMYIVCDENDNTIYTSDYKFSMITDKDAVTIYNSEKKIIGKVKEKVFSFKLPFQEDVVRCQMTLGNKKTCTIKRYKLFRELHFDTEEGGGYYIRYNNSNNKKTYRLQKGSKTMAKIIETPMKFVDGYITRYIIEYENPEYKDEIILMTTMLNFLN